MANYNWQIATMRAGSLDFESGSGLEQACKDGFFFVRCPEELDLAPGDRFARSFYLAQDEASPRDPYRGFSEWTSDRLAEYQGYVKRDVDQTEQFFLESRFWRGVYPEMLVRQAECMMSLSLCILTAVLGHIDLPRELWEQATGQCLVGRGTYHLTFNHFRPEKRARGLNVHKDSGWVTLLRTLEPGLEVSHEGHWLPIQPFPGHFIVNFGCAFEILTRKCRTPVAAVPHRVVEQVRRSPEQADRFSYALFVDSSFDRAICPGLYCYDPEMGLNFEMDFKAFLDRILKNTYDHDSVGLY